MSLSRKLISSLILGAVLATALPVLADQAAVTAVAQVDAKVATEAATTAGAALDPRYGEPGDLVQAGDAVMFGLQLGKTGYWLGLALVVSQLLIFIAKRLPKTNASFKKYGTLFVLFASAVVGLLSLVVGGMKWPEAVLVFLGTVAPKVLADLLTEIGVTPHRDPPVDAPPPAEPPAPVVP